jgi:hypothetical protein
MRISLIVTSCLVAGLATGIAAAEEATLPASVMAAGARTADCDEPIDADSVIESNDLGGGQSLFEVRCWRAAYQSGSIFFLMPANAPDRARLLRFQEPDDKGGFTSSLSLSDPDFDAKTKIMHTHYKGRGVGDCGTIGEWRWTGSDFTLAHYWSKPDCDGELFDDDDAKWQVFPPKTKR